MADFVAVIRRAVDGLANNTPEMRLRVYDKARGAVQRQLENMKPRPSDDMLRRQMDKLEAAITSVEAEHAEALPATEPDLAPAVAAAALAPEALEPTREPEPEPEPVAAPVEDDAASSYSDSAYEHEERKGEAYEPLWQPEPAPVPPAEQYEEPVQEERVEDYHRHADHSSVEAAETPRWDEPAAPVTAPYPDEPPFGRQAELPETTAYQDDADHLIPSHEPTFPTQAPIWPEDPASPHHADDEAREPDFGGERDTHHASSRLVEPMADFGDVPAKNEEPAWLSASETQSEPDLSPKLSWADPVELPRHSDDAVPFAFGEHKSGDQAATENFDAHFETPVSASATAKMPSVGDLPELGTIPSQGFQAGNDPFEEYLRGQPDASTTTAAEVATAGAAGVAVSAAGVAASAAAAQPKPADPDPWNDLEELIGYNKAAAAAAEQAPAAQDDELHDDMMPPPVRPYRAKPKPKRSFGPIILAVLGIVIIGGGGYVAWSNWDKVGEMVGTVGGSATSGTETTQQTPPANQQTPPANDTPAQTPANGQASNGATPPAADGTTSGQKFTQRLLANGTEVDEGAGGPPAGGGGQSVAQLNSPPGTPAATPNEAAGQTPPANAPAVNPADTAAVSGEKMFLYEERLGQPAPTAVEGNVSWSLQTEPGENGRQEPTVQARINIPGRGLTALVTFKRNTDPSLPASHLIELVFSVPPDFEGGAIDSVQRIAMKDTEQDRGTPLVAVPAKITDDFHMIALNDFPDARATNLELLRSKNWLDIPLAYRNGRRALLTLQKGQEGIRAFNTAIREWSTATPSTGQ
ncbi:hypothetical protein GAO09_28475 [Rhizobiales bacterium RZME27]|jgi:hypothetical protein|uniref:Uncharacterized protein n=1 Tax=Endobacterium cereale TaxID=2663029 RepID=A0A6A8AGR0_9HYPH|nr:hypothetical protein [Endobacterium cereale]MEB2845861.1 hypothetical protein [Endobacterium cereale]MQY49969.1 hypothetical protein [Endobacterium cereale]